MWNDGRSHQPLGRHFHDVIGHAHTAPENLRLNDGRRDGLVRVMHVADVGDVDHVRNVCDISDVGYVD
jgi:hypothetical protein